MGPSYLTTPGAFAFSGKMKKERQEIFMKQRANGAIATLLVGAASLLILSSVVKSSTIFLIFLFGGLIMVGLAVWIFFKNNR